MSDVALLFSARILRLFGYGLLSVAFALYLSELGWSSPAIGTLITATLAGDAAVSLAISTRADRLGRRRMLLLGAALMALAGIAFLIVRDPILLALAATLGVISPSGNEIGPFLPIEQAALSQLAPDEQRTRLFAWYNLAGSVATALGALAGGLMIEVLHGARYTPLFAYQSVLLGYAACGAILALLFLRLSPRVEATPFVPASQPGDRRPPATLLGLHRSRGIVLRLSGLFALDAFAGGFVIQSLLAYWFHLRFGLDGAALGGLFFGSNLLAGISALLAAPLARRFGLIHTMVWTHIPSNLLLILVPLMPTATSAVAALLLRFSISQMDVPTRQAYVASVVEPDERSAAAGVTGIARSVGAALSPFLCGLLLEHAGTPGWASVPFFLAGGLKIAYDLLLFRAFRSDRRAH